MEGWGGGGNQALSLSRRGLFHSAGFGSSAGTFLSGLGLFHTRILSFTATCCPLGSYLRGPSRRRTEPVCRRGLRHRAENASRTGGNDSSVQREPRSASRTVGTLRFHSTTLPLSTLITTHYGGLTRTSPPPPPPLKGARSCHSSAIIGAFKRGAGSPVAKTRVAQPRLESKPKAPRTAA